MRIHRLAAVLVLALLLGLLPAAASAKELLDPQPHTRAGQLEGRTALVGIGIVCGLEVTSFTIMIAGAAYEVMPGDNVRWDLLGKPGSSPHQDDAPPATTCQR
jgi:hypothetical protein